MIMFISNHTMSENFISLKEAEKHTGKSRSTLRRFITTITKPDSHPDRGLIEPSVEEVKKLHAANHPFSWTVSTSLLDREFKKEGSGNAEKTGGSTEGLSAAHDLLFETIAMLKTELDQKNKQIDNFQERQREHNVLLKSAHEQLTSLASGATGDSKQSASTVTVENDAAKERSQPSQTAAEPTAKSEKKTLWQRMNQPIFQR